jgi:pimeloyl-ACP methyl ester carboxylesterase
VLRIAHDARSGWLPGTRVDVRSRSIHGYKRVFRVAGAGPPLLLIHGIGDSSRTWDEIMPTLARHHLVIAPDLLGHGESDKPRADYSVAAYANGMRDLLSVLNVERVTVVGHSFGGGVAMQFAYQFPERTERLVLVGSGGAGRGVSPLLRAATLPGANLVTSALRLPGARLAVDLAVELLRLLDTGAGLDAAEIRRIVDDLPDKTARGAFFRTLRSVVDWRGQVITALDRSYLTRDTPVMLVWGDRDSVVPVDHAHIAHAAMPGSRLEIFDGAGHFPFRTDPARFVGILEDFCASTVAAEWSTDRWHELLSLGRAGSPGTNPSAVSADLRTECERSAT